MHPVAYVIMAFGAILTLIGIALLAKGGAQGTSTAKMFGFELQLAGSSLVVFVVGALIFLVPILFPDKFRVPKEEPPMPEGTPEVTPEATPDGTPPVRPPLDEVEIRDRLSRLLEEHDRALAEGDPGRAADRMMEFRQEAIAALVELRRLPAEELHNIRDNKIIQLARKHGLADDRPPVRPPPDEVEIRDRLSRLLEEHDRALAEGDPGRAADRMMEFRQEAIAALVELRRLPAEELHNMRDNEIIELARKHGLADGQKPKEPGATREAEMRQLLSRQFQEYLKALDEGDADRVHARMTEFRNKLILALFEFREFPAEELHKMGDEEIIELAREEGLLPE